MLSGWGISELLCDDDHCHCMALGLRDNLEAMDKASKILMVTTNADLSGAPLHVLVLLRRLHQSGWNVTAVFGEDGEVAEGARSLGVATRVIPTMRSTLNPYADYLSYRALERICLSEEPHSIHCHSSKAGMIARLVGKRLGIPVIYTVHGWGFGPGRKFVVGALVFAIEKILAQGTTMFVTVSEFDRRLGMQRLRIPGKKIRTVRNGITSSGRQHTFQSVDRKIVMVARNSYPKDYRTFARALSLVEFNEALFVGQGTDHPDFKSEVVSYVRTDPTRLSFLGLRKDVDKILEVSSVFVLSSWFEGLPMSVIEAMRAGLPIVASDVGGINELVDDGVNGFLFPAGDWVGLAERISLLMASSDLRERMGLASREKFEREFREERMIDEIFTIYSTVGEVSP